MVIRRIGPLSFAKLSGFLYGLLGLVFGAVFSLIALAGGAASSSARGAGLGAMVGVGAVIIFPILYGVFGFIASLIAAWFYNLAASVVGGVEMDVQ